MTSTLTIADVIADTSLDTRLLSGASGLDRPVLWAHSCEMAEPNRWLGPHELLMTIGLCIPQGSQAQRAFIAKLDEAGLAAIAIGEDGIAPRFTKAMLAESESRGFPILSTGGRTPFAAIGRTVAAANAERQTMGVLRLAKLYQVAGRLDAAERRSGAALRDVLGAEVTVVDEETGCVVIGDGVLAEDGSRRHVLRTQRRCFLTVGETAELDGFSMVHLTQILAVDANSILQEAMERIRGGTELLERALSGRADAREEVMRIWNDSGAEPYRALVTDCSVPSRVPLAIALSGRTPVSVRTNGRLLLAVPRRDVESLRGLLSDLGVTTGVSAEHHDLSDLGGAVEEATTEYLGAAAHGERWREFQGERVSLLARSHSESEQIARVVLGPLAGDDAKNTMLRDTLFSFLDSDLSWKATADALGLHRQSLVYRLAQVEQRTGRSVRRTKDISEFWLARMSWDLLNGPS